MGGGGRKSKCPVWASVKYLPVLRIIFGFFEEGREGGEGGRDREG